MTLPTPTATSTSATTPLPTSTATPVVYQVRSGDTLVTIASLYDVEVEALMEANQISDQDIYALQPGQMLYIPSATPEVEVEEVTAASLAVAAPTSTPVVYAVQTGDTLVSIASFYDIEVEALMEANQIGARDVFALQPGQLLNIPLPATAVEPVVAVASDAPAFRVDAPLLVVPTDDAIIGCATGGKLIWQRVQFVKDSDHYVLHLGFVNGQKADGQEDVVWVLAQSGAVTQTEWELDTSLCDLAPAEYDRQWRWWVEVVEEVDGRTVPVSPPSATRGFVWQ
jgi:LysM repeat protein